MTLKSINNFLRWIGLVMVVMTDPNGVRLTELWIERLSTYRKRLELSKLNIILEKERQDDRV